jgi:hypothetical protein
MEAGVEPARTSRGERYAMNETSNVVPLRQPDEIDDPLTKAASHEAYTSTTCIIPSSS